MSVDESMLNSRFDDAGVIKSKFDRGVMRNILEFMEWGDYRIDYYNLHGVPNTITEVRVNSLVKRTSAMATALVKRVSKFVGGAQSSNNDVLLDDIYGNSSNDTLSSASNVNLSAYAQRTQRNMEF